MSCLNSTVYSMYFKKSQDMFTKTQTFWLLIRKPEVRGPRSHVVTGCRSRAVVAIQPNSVCLRWPESPSLLMIWLMALWPNPNAYLCIGDLSFMESNEGQSGEVIESRFGLGKGKIHRPALFGDRKGFLGMSRFVLHSGGSSPGMWWAC